MSLCTFLFTLLKQIAKSPPSPQPFSLAKSFKVKKRKCFKGFGDDDDESNFEEKTFRDCFVKEVI